MEPVLIPDLKASIEKLALNEHVDFPKENTTASATRQAVQRIYATEEANIEPDMLPFLGRVFKVSETAYPGGTRVTRIK